MVARKHHFRYRERKVLFSKTVKPDMIGLEMPLKENFLTYSAQFVFLVIRIVPGNVVMVSSDMCGKSPITREWIYGITWKHVYFDISVYFTVYTTSILKSVIPNCLWFVF